MACAESFQICQGKLFLGLVVIERMSCDRRVLKSSHCTLCEDSEACCRKNHGMGMFIILWCWTYLLYTGDHGLVWKHQNTWRDYVVLLCRRENALQHNTTTPNTQVNYSSILVSDKKDWGNWVATVQLNPLTSTPLKTCGFTLKMQFLEQNPKIHRIYGIVCSSWVEIPVVQLVDSMQWCTAVIKNMVMQLKNL